MGINNIIPNSTTFTSSGSGVNVESKLTLDGYNIDLSAGADVGQVLHYNGTSFIAATPAVTDGLNTAYIAGNSTQNIIDLVSGSGPILIRDNATPLGTTLFGVQDSTGTTKFLDVTSSALTLTSNNLTLQRTGGAHGTISLTFNDYLNGDTGVTFGNATSLGMFEFDLQASSVIRAIRLETRSGTVKKTTSNAEFQFGSPGSPQFVVGDLGIWTKVPFELTSDGGGLLVRDNATPLGTTLFGVQDSTGTTKYLDITDSASQTITSGVTMTGTSVGTIIDSVNLFTNGDKLLSIRSSGIEQLYVGQDGANSVTVRSPSNITHFYVANNNWDGLHMGESPQTVWIMVGGSNHTAFDTAGVYPFTNNRFSLGTSTNRWINVYAYGGNFLGVANATSPVLTVQGGPTPGVGGDLQQWQDSSSNVLAKVDATGALTTAINNIGTASTIGSSLQNNTAATSTQLQYSPMQEFVGQMWNTTTLASAPVKLAWQNQSKSTSGTSSDQTEMALLASSPANTDTYTPYLLIKPVILSSTPGFGLWTSDSRTGISFASGSATATIQVSTNHLFGFDAADFYPSPDNTFNNGRNTLRWKGVWSYWYDTDVGAQLTAASSITPTAGIHHATGATPITTIATTNVPTNANVFEALIADAGSISYATGGNIAAGGTIAQNTAGLFVYDSGTSTWYPVSPPTAATTQTLNSIYSTTTQADNIIGLTADGYGVIIQDNVTPIGSTLFGVQDSYGTTKYLDVQANGVSVANGNVSFDSNGKMTFAAASGSNSQDTITINGPAASRPIAVNITGVGSWYFNQSTGFVHNNAGHTFDFIASGSSDGFTIQNQATRSSPSLKVYALNNMTAPILLVQGGATPGTGGDLQQWQDTNSNILAKIDAYGNLTSLTSTIGTSTALPTASSSNRGMLYTVQGAAGTADITYQCVKSSGDTYSWVQVLTGDGHIVATGSAPSITAGAAATSPGIGGHDSAGQIGFTGANATGTICTVTFAQPFKTTPYVVISPANQNASALTHIYISSVSASAFSLATTDTPSGVLFLFNYMVIQ